VTSMREDVRILGLKRFPIVKPGDDIADLVIRSTRSLNIPIQNDDILVIGHKIISKAEGRIVSLSDINPSSRAIKVARRCRKDPRLVELILKESRRIVKAEPGILLVETKSGFVCLNAGIDRSNVDGPDTYCLLPSDPKRSASRIAGRMRTRTGKRVRVVVTDTYSRPFRVGQSEFAIGISGLDPFVDYRGSKDLFGSTLKFKRVSIADELASAGELVMGQGSEGVPAAIIKGVKRIRTSRGSVGARLVMRKSQDLFREAL
jgi:coenzyme F420-0:L-glutamate ligase / coenzyme F420-1:gamma-L-glutamate ligase